MKKVLAIVLTVAMVLGLAACGGGKTTPTNNSNTSPSSELAGEYKVLVWCPSEAKELTTKQIEDFNKSNTLGIKIVATVNEMSESEAGTQVLNDVSAGIYVKCSGAGGGAWGKIDDAVLNSSN